MSKLESIAVDHKQRVGILAVVRGFFVRSRKVEAVYHVPAYLLRDIGVDPDADMRYRD